MVCLRRPYQFKFFKGCLPQILLGPFLNTSSHLFVLNLDDFERSLHKSNNFQKQLFAGVLENRCCQKFRKIHRKTPVLESEACNFIKKETPTQVLSCEFCEIFENTNFHRTSPVAVSKFLPLLLVMH